MSTRDTFIFTVAIIVFFLIVFLAHYFYQDYLWYISVESFIPWLQSYTWGPYKRFMRCLFWFGWEIMWLIVIVFYSYFNKASSTFLLIGVSEVIAVICVFQMFWSHPSPYMKSDKIDAFECDRNSFQNPALEVAISAFAYSLMFYLAFDWIEIKRPRVRISAEKRVINKDEIQPVFEDEEPEYFLSDGSKYQKAKRNELSFWIWLTFTIFIVLTIAYSSMYIGSNSLDQVLFALTLGYGFFFVYYYYFKDMVCERVIKVSEKMIETSEILKFAIFHVLIIGLFMLGARYYYFVKNKDYVVNPSWVNEHNKQCNSLPFPSFFDKELLYIYDFLYLDLGVALGVTFDSLFLDGTRVDYNQPRKSENKAPLISFIVRLVFTLGWIFITIWLGTYYLKMMVHHNLFLLAIPYFICGLGLTSFCKYMFMFLDGTRNEIYPIASTNAVELRKVEPS